MLQSLALSGLHCAKADNFQTIYWLDCIKVIHFSLATKSLKHIFEFENLMQVYNCKLFVLPVNLPYSLSLKISHGGSLPLLLIDFNETIHTKGPRQF